MICKSCGNEGGNAKFCVNCGAALEAPVEVAAEPVEVVAEPVEVVEPVAEPVYAPSETQSVYTQETAGIDDSSNPYYGQEVVNEYGEPVVAEQKGLSIASLVLGILAIIGICFPCCGYIFGITGLIMGIVGRKKGAAKLGTAGMICSIVGLVGCVINSICGAVLATQGVEEIFKGLY